MNRTKVEGDLLLRSADAHSLSAKETVVAGYMLQIARHHDGQTQDLAPYRPCST